MEIFRLHIHVTEENSFDTETNTINMILFDGTCEGEYFNGKILNGGVDTQIYEKGGAGTLSARYMLRGMDKEGVPCRLFIENNGIVGKEETYTTPKIYTDSKCLKWLEKKELAGKILMENDELIISIYSKDK